MKRRPSPARFWAPLATALAAFSLTACWLLALPPGAGAAPPSVAIGEAVEVTATTAVVVGAVDPDGLATTYAFQYGPGSSYGGQTAVHSVDPPITYKTLTALLTGLRPGTTYSYRVIATNASGTTASKVLRFTTAGHAQPVRHAPVATTGPATVTGAGSVVLTGTVTTLTSNVTYYFELGTTHTYDLRTIDQPLLGGLTRSAQAPISGLQGAREYHYRLVAVDGDGEATVGADRTFVMPPARRLPPRALVVRAAPAVSRRLPVTIVVSGRLVPPRSLPPAVACRGFVDIAFRVHSVAVQLLRAGIRQDCTFRLRVRFSQRRRLHGGHVQVRVLFPGNVAMNRLAAHARHLRIG